MLFPLGLGFHFRKVPIITLCVAVALLLSYGFDSPSPTQIYLESDAGIRASKIPKTTRTLFEEYCRKKNKEEKRCKFIGEKIEAKISGKPKPREKDQSRDLFSLREELNANKFLKVFFARLDQEATDIKALSAYPAYRKSRENLQAYVLKVQKKYGLLSRKNVDFLPLFQAQVKHSGIAHLLSNLFMLLVFGAYVELRIGALLYLITYLVGGFIGLGAQLLAPSSSIWHIVGASANISAVMGAFFVLFFRFRMKLLFWAFVQSRTVYAQVAIYFPILYICNDLIGAISASGGFMGGGVAHLAHLGGLVFGMGMGFVAKELIPLAWPYIYLEEPQETSKLKAVSTLDSKITSAQRLLLSNPENLLARYLPICEILNESEISPGTDTWSFLHAEMPTCLSQLTRKNKIQVACDLIEAVPLTVPLYQLLHSSGKELLLRLGDHAVDQFNLPVAVRIYEVVIQRFPKTVKAIELRKTLLSIMENLSSDRPLQEFWHLYGRLYPQSAIFSVGIPLPEYRLVEQGAP